MKKLLFIFTAVLMASTAYAGHWVTFEAEEFEYASGHFYLEKDGVTIHGYGRANVDHFRFYANNTASVYCEDGINEIDFICISEDEQEYGPYGFAPDAEVEQGQRGRYFYSGNLGYWKDGIFTQGEFTPFDFDYEYGEENAHVNAMQQVDLSVYHQVRCTTIRVYVLSDATPQPPVVDQVGAPTFIGYTEDGIYGYGVYIVPTTEGSSIKYRVFIEEDGQWVLVTDWTDYQGAPMEIWMNLEDARYRVEAYAYIGDVRSNTVAYEYQVEPWTSIDEMNASKAIAGVRYFNLAGQEMQEANGLTIVVTTYTDGTTSAAKVVK